MKTPYEILAVASDATDVEIKQAYLQKIKDNPPDRDQDLFQVIQNAYQAIKDHASRLSYELFTLPTVEFDELLDHALDVTRTEAINSEQFNQLLRASIDETTLLSTLHRTEKS